ncbi:MAG: sulfotransferase [Pseudomonadota bacterium]
MKLLQVGFNKCGTRTLHLFLEANGWKSGHWDRGAIAETLKQNLDMNDPNPLGRYADYDALFDVTFFGDETYFDAAHHFKALDVAYPDARFVLNTRNVDDWIISRFNHARLAERFAHYHDLRSDAEIAAHWRREWYHQHSSVLEHFKGRPEKLLVFDIDRHGAEELIEFLGDRTLDPSLYTVSGQTTAKNKTYDSTFGKKRLKVGRVFVGW